MYSWKKKEKQTMSKKTKPKSPVTKISLLLAKGDTKKAFDIGTVMFRFLYNMIIMGIIGTMFYAFTIPDSEFSLPNKICVAIMCLLWVQNIYLSSNEEINEGKDLVKKK